MDFFDSAYRGRPPWDIGRPQKEFVELVRRGEITGSVLDIGCGTGEHALFFAAEGFEVWGIDSVPLVMDVLDLTRLNRKFDTVTDSGFFHTLSDEDRPVFVNNLSAVLPAGGRYFMLCFSELEPAGYGPRRITEREIRDSFSDGWAINYIRAATFESHTREKGSRSWFSSISKK
jgi:cyclopropane fatty-acyl-phospholipid synthase-like methyltransferase